MIADISASTTYTRTVRRLFLLIEIEVLAVGVPSQVTASSTEDEKQLHVSEKFRTA
jgi:hypothetical protein